MYVHLPQLFEPFRSITPLFSVSIGITKEGKDAGHYVGLFVRGPGLVYLGF